MSSTIKTPLEIYEICYNAGNVASIPAGYNITENFSWREAFTNEIAMYGVPSYDTFLTIQAAAKVFQKARTAIGKPFIIHCWYRCVKHNKKAGSTARLSPHILGRAIDFHVDGMSIEELRKKVSSLNLPLRVEEGTTTYVHVDVGNPYISNGYKWGLFKA